MPHGTRIVGAAHVQGDRYSTAMHSLNSRQFTMRDCAGTCAKAWVSNPLSSPSLQVILDTLEFSGKIKKTPVLVGNCTGFAVNRVFFPYTQASALSEGCTLAAAVLRFLLRTPCLPRSAAVRLEGADALPCSHHCLQAACMLVDMGLDPYRIDAAIAGFGMPMGPFRYAGRRGRQANGSSAESMRHAWGL